MATSPSLRLIGERGPEAVVPLHKLSQLGGGGVNLGGITVNLQRGSSESDAQFENRIIARIIQGLRESGALQSIVKNAARRGL